MAANQRCRLACWPCRAVCSVMVRVSVVFGLVLSNSLAVSAKAAQPQTARGPDTYVISVILKDTTPEFSTSLREGFHQAILELSARGVTVKVISDQPEKPAGRTAQTQAMEEAIQKHVKGIILAARDRKTPIASVEKAVAKGIPVVLIDSGVDSTAQSSLVASDNREIGRMAARYLAKLLGGRGNVMLLRKQIHSANTEEREEGFLEVILTAHPNIRIVVSDFHAGPSAETAKRVSAGLIQRHGGKFDGVFASSESATVGLMGALRDAGCAGGKVKVIGVSEGGGILPQAMAAGDLQGLLAQDAVAIGYQAMKTMVSVLRGEKVARDIFTPTVLVTNDGVFFPPPRRGPGQRTRAALSGAVSANRAKKTAVAAEQDASGGDFTVAELGLTLVAIHPGSFTMGGAGGGPGRGDEGPPTRVTLSSFWLGKHEITQAAWSAIMGSNPSDFRNPALPVDTINWNDATEFCRRLSERERAAGRLRQGYAYTLPTEAQWEYACRAGTTTPFAGEPDQMGWFVTNSGAIQPATGIWRLTTHPAGEKQPNRWGLYDMHGNVSEWCFDWYGEYPGGSVVDPTGPGTGDAHVIRGGAWWADAEACRSGARHRAPPTRAHSGLGLRVALSRATHVAP